jgi:NAD(P)-dependent dehydrogenase (short-subunit alcohol dehydrogenase family)
MGFADEFGGGCAVVTGAGSGIGRAIAHSFADAGMNVVAADVEADAASRTAAEIDERGVEALGVATDVSQYEAVLELADATYEHFGAVNVLCNNAGVSMRPFRTVWNTSYEDYRWVLGVNYWGVVHGVLAFLPRMREQQDGRRHIVNVSSMAAHRKIRGASAYVSSKRAMEGFSEVLGRELEPDGIGVTIVYPGRVRTRIAESERLRPEHEQSGIRGVEAFTGEVLNTDANPNPELEPAEVAAMVCRAIVENRRYLLTHPAPRGDMLERVGELLGAPVEAPGR